MIKAYKYRLYPTKDQEVLLSKHFGCVRFIYNWGLDFKTKYYKETNKNIGYMQISGKNGALADIKKENEWLKEVNSQSLVSALGNLDRAYTNFFSHRAKFPKFKKKSNKQSFQVPQHGWFDTKNNRLHIPKFKEGIYCKIHRKLPAGKQGTITISKNPSGRYFASVIVEIDEPLKEKSKPRKETTIGIDFGLKTFLTTSKGEKIYSPEFLKKNLAKLQKLSKQHSKKQKGSKNKEKARIKLARLHEKISNQRLDFLHKLSSKFVSENQTICIEDLNLQGMSKLWGRKINDLSYYAFTQMLLYKSVWNGKNLIKIGRFDPSSQICSNCGYQNHDLKITDRTWKCPNCDSDLNRDINAAINIRDFGLNEFNLRQELSEVKPLERKALTKRNRKKSFSETIPDELGKNKSHSEMEARVALATL
jgi:putative transposase